MSQVRTTEHSPTPTMTATGTVTANQSDSSDSESTNQNDIRQEKLRFYRMKKQGEHTVKTILLQDKDTRTDSETFYLRMHLKVNVPFFAFYDGIILKRIVNCLKQREYKPGDMIIRKGDIGEEMYINIVGDVGIYLDEKLTSCAAVLRENKVFGESSLQTSEERTAFVIAHTKCTCLVLSKADFNEQVFHVE